ncbi:DUF3164 family protein [Parabacteroides merdae]|jgi:hypothetical protein|uniref:DUF3164 family protein n=1 Tax=Parabacteroides merdae TaxID=46503 RepID=UPI001B6A79F6|nr:DUF3164 family protein [Parabacteroides merdae]MBP3642621.1 DUF3164 family protein [Parabacteroides sp.]
MEDLSKKTIDLSKLSEEEVNNILLQAEALKRQKKEERARDEEALDALENDLVIEMFNEARKLSEGIVMFKNKWINKLNPLVDEKIKYNKAKADQGSYTFKTINADLKVRMCNNRRSRYDDGIQAGIGFAKEWMQSQVDGEKSKRLISYIDDLLTKDQKGNYSPDNLLKFIKKAEEDGDELLLKASECLKKSIYEERTTTSLLLFEKDDKGFDRPLPLSATKA